MKDYPRAGGNARGPLFYCPEHNQFFGPDQKAECELNEDGAPKLNEDGTHKLHRPSAERCSGCEPQA